MIALKRVLPYPEIYVRAVALDMVESLSNDATVNKNQWQLIATVNVYGNESYVSINIAKSDTNHSVLCINMLTPAPTLSAEGQSRVLSFLADGMEQLLENTFA